jgi:hypothetical protein
MCARRVVRVNFMLDSNAMMFEVRRAILSLSKDVLASLVRAARPACARGTTPTWNTAATRE